MAQVLLKNLTKKFDDVVAVNTVNLEISDREFVVLVGPSGCGKTTTLRMIAGLEEITEGDIYIGDRLVNNLASKDRNIAMVFQSYALYPHMKVFDNMAFGLKMRKIPKEERSTLVNDAAEILGIQDLLDRKPKQLSGGQRQRVALGRAIVRKPDVFLFDEPLSNLDAKLRVQMMGDRIVVMNNGLIQQVGSPLELYNKPANLFVAGFIGSPSMNFIDCRVAEENGTVLIETSGFKVALPEDLAAKARAAGADNFIFGVRPEDITKKGAGEPSARKSETVEARINVIETLGKETYLDITAGNETITAIVSPSTRVSPEENIELEINLDKIHLFNKDGGEAIF
jgi:multiple sugar transport system ATP-binding protein